MYPCTPDTPSINDMADDNETFSTEEQKMMDTLSQLHKEIARKKAVDMEKNAAAKRMAAAMFSRYYKQLLSEGKPTGTLLDDVPKEVVDCYLKQSKKTDNHMMITINSKDGIDPMKFWKRYEEWVKNQTIVIPVIASLEQKGEGTTPAHGWHIHLIGKTQLCPSKLAQRMIKSFSSFVAAGNYIDGKWIKKDLEYRIGYLKGGKRDEKLGKVEKDTEYKNALGIPLYVEYPQEV